MKQEQIERLIGLNTKRIRLERLLGLANIEAYSVINSDYYAVLADYSRDEISRIVIADLSERLAEINKEIESY